MRATPKTLEQAIRNGMDEPASDVFKIRDHVRDYLSQAFTVAMHVAPTQEESDRLEVLFNKLVQEGGQ